MGITEFTYVMAGQTEQTSIKIKVNKYNAVALIDSGSDSTIIHPKILNFKEIDQIEQASIQIKGINGGLLPLMGVLKCIIQICDQKIATNVRVSRVSPHECVIGKDVLRQLSNVMYDCATGALVKTLKRENGMTEAA